MDIVRQLIRDDGGEGTVEEVVPGEHGLGIFNTLLRDPASFDATWVFMPWEVLPPRSHPLPFRSPGPCRAQSTHLFSTPTAGRNGND